MTKLLIFGSFALNQAQAQTYPWGSYQQPMPDSSFNVLVVQDIMLKVDAVSYDSLVWQTDFGYRYTNPILAESDINGRVLVKKNSKWTFRDVLFNGIKRSGDTLITAKIENAVYRWTRDGIVQGSTSYKISANTPGYYKVGIKLPSDSTTNIAYAYKVNGVVTPPSGSTIGTAISDPSILGQSFNMFTAATSADSIVWDFNGTRHYEQTNTFYAFENGNGALFIKNAGVWKRADFAFEGVLFDGTTLRANVIAKNAVYGWSKDGVGIQGANSNMLEFSGSGLYTLNVGWIPNSTFPGGSGTYTKQITVNTGGVYTPLEVSDLIIRSGSTYSINPKYAPDSVKWMYYNYTPPQSGSVIYAKTPSITLNMDVVIRATIIKNNKYYTQKDIYYYNDTLIAQGTFKNPIDSIFIVKSDVSFTVNSGLNADSADWSIVNAKTGAIRSSNLSSETLNSDADVSVKVKSQGKWYRDQFLFKGISFDSTNSGLQAPVIANALYQWYFNGQLLAESTAQLNATQAGTYEVVVTWTESGSNTSNSRIAEVTKTATYTFVVTPKMVTGLNEGADQQAVALQLYPNPAVNFVSLANVEGSFTYSICSVSGNEVLNGQSVANANIDISSLESGVYMMNIKTQVSQVTKRIIVK